MTKLLFICSRNQWRSSTAERVFRELGYLTRSAGTHARARRVVSVADLRWADVVLVMEDKHQQRLLAAYPRLLAYKPLQVLNIPDDYLLMDTALIALLHERVPEALAVS